MSVYGARAYNTLIRIQLMKSLMSIKRNFRDCYLYIKLLAVSIYKVVLPQRMYTFLIHLTHTHTQAKIIIIDYI